MKRLFIILFYCVFSCSAQEVQKPQVRIIETQNITDLLEYVDQKTHVAIDFDEVILKYSGKDKKVSKLVEEEKTLQTICEVFEKAEHAFMLTNRHIHWNGPLGGIRCVDRQLKEVGIEFPNKLPFLSDLKKDNKPQVVEFMTFKDDDQAIAYHAGKVLTSGESKPFALALLYNTIGYEHIPEKFVFIDDRLEENIHAMQQFFTQQEDKEEKFAKQHHFSERKQYQSMRNMVQSKVKEVVLLHYNKVAFEREQHRVKKQKRMKEEAAQVLEEMQQLQALQESFIARYADK